MKEDRKRQMLKKIIMVIGILTCQASLGAPFDRLSEVLGDEIFSISRGLEESQFFEKRNSQGGFNFTGFEINFQTPMGFTLPHLINIEIVPEIEIVWEKIE